MYRHVTLINISLVASHPTHGSERSAAHASQPVYMLFRSSFREQQCTSVDIGRLCRQVNRATPAVKSGWMHGGEATKVPRLADVSRATLV